MIFFVICTGRGTQTGAGIIEFKTEKSYDIVQNILLRKESAASSRSSSYTAPSAITGQSNTYAPRATGN